MLVSIAKLQILTHLYIIHNRVDEDYWLLRQMMITEVLDTDRVAINDCGLAETNGRPHATELHMCPFLKLQRLCKSHQQHEH